MFFPNPFKLNMDFSSKLKYVRSLQFLCIFCICISTASALESESAESPRSHPSLLQRFWNIGCEFSGVVSRVRRSTDNPPTPEPNFNDPEELFNYLYPLANVGDEESQRSAPGTGTHSISSWLEDLMELWHSECQHRREKRSTKRRARAANGNGNTGRASGEGRLRRKEYAWLRNGDKQVPSGPSGMRNASLANTLRRQGYEDEGYEDNGYSRDEILEEELDKEEDKEEDKLEEVEGIFDKDKDKLTGLLSTAAGLLPPKPDPQKPVVNLPSMAENKKEDIFFSQYGGDIEYFFPLLSFGIPFDGEITLLGFHGFRGIFPY